MFELNLVMTPNPTTPVIYTVNQTRRHREYLSFPVVAQGSIDHIDEDNYVNNLRKWWWG